MVVAVCYITICQQEISSGFLAKWVGIARKSPGSLVMGYKDDGSWFDLYKIPALVFDDNRPNE